MKFQVAFLILWLSVVFQIAEAQKTKPKKKKKKPTFKQCTGKFLTKCLKNACGKGSVKKQVAKCAKSTKTAKKTRGCALNAFKKCKKMKGSAEGWLCSFMGKEWTGGDVTLKSCALVGQKCKSNSLPKDFCTADAVPPPAPTASPTVSAMPTDTPMPTGGIGSASCQGIASCQNNGGFVTVLDDSCTNTNTCSSNIGNINIADQSCKGQDACSSNGSVKAGSSSCNGDNSCSNNDNMEVGDNSCSSMWSCAENFGFAEFITVKIGKNSCQGEQACTDIGESITIGDNACNGKDACQFCVEDVPNGGTECVGSR